MASLTRLKNSSRQKEFDEAWLPEHDDAFADVKAAIATATQLVHPQPDAPTEIWCDASNIAVGAVLVQLQHGIWKPLSFWSRQLNNAQRNYSATDRELLAVSYAVDKFRSYLEGQPIVVRTDHKPLVGSVTKKADTAIPVPRRHLLKIAQFVDQLHYMKAERNGVADALSRVRLQSKVGIWMSEQDDVADTLPTEGSHYAIQEDALVDQTFLQQRKRQRDMHNKQLRDSVIAPAHMTLKTQVSSDTQSVSPPFFPHEGEPHTSSSADHETCTCKRVVRFSRLSRHSLSCYLRLQISGLHKNTISHCRTGLLITVLRLLDSNQTWSSVKMVLVCGQMSVLHQHAFLYRPHYSALFSTVCIVSHTQG